MDGLGGECERAKRAKRAKRGERKRSARPGIKEENSERGDSRLQKKKRRRWRCVRIEKKAGQWQAQDSSRGVWQGDTENDVWKTRAVVEVAGCWLETRTTEVRRVQGLERERKVEKDEEGRARLREGGKMTESKKNRQQMRRVEKSNRRGSNNKNENKTREEE